MNLSKCLLLHPKNIMFIIISWIVAVVLHNLVSAVFHFEEAVFFIIAVIIIPLYFILSLIYSLIFLIIKLTKKRNKEVKKTSPKKVKRINRKKKRK